MREIPVLLLFFPPWFTFSLTSICFHSASPVSHQETDALRLPGDTRGLVLHLYSATLSTTPHPIADCVSATNHIHEKIIFFTVFCVTCSGISESFECWLCTWHYLSGGFATWLRQHVLTSLLSLRMNSHQWFVSSSSISSRYESHIVRGHFCGKPRVFCQGWSDSSSLTGVCISSNTLYCLCALPAQNIRLPPTW